MLNILLQNSVGNVTNALLPENFSREQFAKLMSDKFGNIEGRFFVVDNKQLNLNDEDQFNQEKGRITDGKMIFVLERLPGGGFVEMSILIDIIIDSLTAELVKVPKRMHQCVVCQENKPCMQLCHSKICADSDCFVQYFKSNDLKLNCPICHTNPPYEHLFVSLEFIASLRSLDELKNLMKNIDCQVCHCGALLLNPSMYPRKDCTQCGRRFCFFCNKDWDETAMLNVSKGTCHNNCDYETRISYQLVPFQFNTAFQIPDRRCCPNCLNIGAYGERCKYHECSICRYVFCFICLESETNCKTIYSSTYAHKCTEVQKQDYSIFPRLCPT